MPFWKKKPAGPRILPTGSVVAMLRATRFKEPKSAAEFIILTVMFEVSECFLQEAAKTLGRHGVSKPRSAFMNSAALRIRDKTAGRRDDGGTLFNQDFVLEARALFAFWMNHLLWKAGQSEECRASLIGLATLGTALEYFGRNPSTPEFDQIGDLLQQRAEMYRECVEKQGLIVMRFMGQCADSGYLGGAFNTLSRNGSQPHVYALYDPFVAFDLAPGITATFETMATTIKHLVDGTQDFRVLAESDISARLSAASVDMQNAGEE
jgi:hypothetical protein